MLRLGDPWVLPNLLTFLRLPCCVLMVAFFTERLFAATLVVYLITEVLDQADGKVARAFGWETLTGRFFDPFVDSFVHLTAFACLLTIGIVPLWIFLVFLFRESSVSFLRLLASLQGIRLGGAWPGKTKAVIHGLAISVCLLSLSTDSAGLSRWPNTLVLLALVASILSGLYYLALYRTVLIKSFLVREIV